MLDINFIRENVDLIKKAAKAKRIEFDVDGLIKLDSQRRELLKKVEALRAEKNAANQEISKLKDKEKEKAIKNMKTITANEKKLDEELKEVTEKFEYQLLFVPQPASPETPLGESDKDNKELYTVGEIPKFDFNIKDHVMLGQELDILDIPRGVKLGGSRSYFLKGDGALLELAVLKFTIDKLVAKGFTLFIVPNLVTDFAMTGTSYFPGGEEQAYRIEKDQLNLIGTSEVSVTAYHSGEILKEEELPKKYAGYSPCYRREAGTYGKDTHGIYRIHQFQKVEQVILCKNDPEESKKMHQMILKNSEEVLQALKLPYRVVAVCTGDMGQGQYYKNDIETWMPSRNNYGETHSCSTFLEFQSRRLNMRYKGKDGKIHFCHTLNNTCIASPRVLIPILEIYQQKDGSVEIPEVLRPYMGGRTKIEQARSGAKCQ